MYQGKAADESGEAVARALAERGFEVSKVVAPSKPLEILAAVRRAQDSRLVVIVGGTGPSPRDIAVDVARSVAWREVEGFGEEFRRRSYARVGPRGLLSNAGLFITYDGRAVAALPGSRDGAMLGLELLLELLPHLLEEAARIEGPHRVE